MAGPSSSPATRRCPTRALWPRPAAGRCWPSRRPGTGPGSNALGTYRLLLDHLGDDIERVVVAGRPTLSRQVTRLLARTDLEVVRLRDDPRTPKVTGDSERGWLNQWLDADALADDAVAQVLIAEPLNGLAVARVVAASVPAGGLLVAGSSSAVRDLDLADPWDADPPRVLANRGASGIDGTVSTAIGAALAHGGPAYALMGDLTFLHDSTGLVIGPAEPRPDLTIVVVNDDGGGLFTQLEQGAAEHAAVFERVFGTPHGVDLAALCAATGTPHVLAEHAGRAGEGARCAVRRTRRGGPHRPQPHPRPARPHPRGRRGGPAMTDIRRLGPGDDALVVAAEHLFDGPARPDATARFLAEDGHHLLVAYDDGQPVGMVTGVETTHPDKGTEMFLYELAVDEAARGRGVGRALVAALADLARDRGCYGMWVLTDDDNPAAVRAYTAAGGKQEPLTRLIAWDWSAG